LNNNAGIYIRALALGEIFHYIRAHQRFLASALAFTSNLHELIIYRSSRKFSDKTCQVLIYESSSTG